MTKQSTQPHERQQLAQGYTRFGIKIWEDLIQHLVKIRSRCVPHSPNLDILKRVLSVRESNLPHEVFEIFGGDARFNRSFVGSTVETVRAVKQFDEKVQTVLLFQVHG
jgi:hypothetical protein